MMDEMGNEEVFDEPEDKPIKQRPEKKKKAVKITKKTIKSLEGKFIHIRLGDADGPASDGDIKDLTEKMDELLNRYEVSAAVLVTHHAVVIDIR